MNNSPKNILITGASSGIGAALAVHYAAPGVTLFLSGRHAARLEDKAAQCRTAGAVVYTELVDVTDRQSMENWITGADQTAPLDLVVANAGISGGTGAMDGKETVAQARQIFAINMDGLLNTITPILPRMEHRGAGQIALMSSLAGFSGWSTAPAYAASKGVARLYGEGLRGALAPHGVRINVICPGFVTSRITAMNNFPMPFLMRADKAARIIARGLARNKSRIAFPWPTYMAVGFLGLWPAGWLQAVQRFLPKKPANSL